LLILASGSPRRARILEELRIPFEIRVPDVDETPAAGESGPDLVMRLGRAKAGAVEALFPGGTVLAADTEVLCDGEVLGKPAGAPAAVAMLRRLASRSHEVVTGLCLLHAGAAHAGIARTLVTFASMTDPEIAAYVATGECFDKAGGYHVHGRGAFFIAGISGSPSNVAGLPVRLLYELAAEAGVSLLPGVDVAAR
jgi:septum formation protein